MLIISLKTFAQTGKFGFVEMQMTKTKVIELLGKPNEDSINGDIDIILYGSYEFFFWDRNLIGIQNESLQYFKQDLAAFSNDVFRIDPWFINGRKERTYKGVVLFLKKAQMTYHEKIEYGLIFLYLSSGVSFDFLDHSPYSRVFMEDSNRRQKVIIPKKEDYILVGIRYHPPL
jgi:hypothetical protein